LAPNVVEAYTELSQGVRFPAEFVAKSVASNLTVTAGKFMVEAGFVAQHDDPHRDIELVETPSVKKGRSMILTETLVKALGHYRNELGL
jgi:hypothetical protein